MLGMFFKYNMRRFIIENKKDFNKKCNNSLNNTDFRAGIILRDATRKEPPTLHPLD